MPLPDNSACHFIQSYWDKLIVAIIAVYGAVLSTYTFLDNKKKDTRIARDEVSRVLWETKEIAPKVALLDGYIFDQRFFTRRQPILDALAAIKDYWKRNEASLRRFLDAEKYNTLRGLYDFALANVDNQPPPNGNGTWLSEEKLLGQKVAQILDNATIDLQRRLR